MVKYIKTLQYNDLLYASIGHIFGAGIFSLIGITYNYAGNNTWLSVILSGSFIWIIAKAYMKLSKYENNKDMEYEIIKIGYGDNMSKLVMWCAILGGIFITHIVANVFGNYFNDLTDLSSDISVLIVLGLCLLINLSGIKLVSVWNNILTLSILSILVLFILFGLYKLIIDKEFGFIKDSFELKNIKNNIWNIIKGAYIIIFSYFGFELLIKFNRESIDPSINIPKALKNSIFITIIMYTLIGFIYSYSMYLKNKHKDKYNNLISDKEIPLTNSINILAGTKKYSKILSIAGAVTTFTTILLTIAGTSRLLDTQLNIDHNEEIPKKSLTLITMSAIVLYMLRINLDKSTILANGFIIILFIGVFMSVRKVIDSK